MHQRTAAAAMLAITCCHSALGAEPRVDLVCDGVVEHRPAVKGNSPVTISFCNKLFTLDASNSKVVEGVDHGRSGSYEAYLITRERILFKREDLKRKARGSDLGREKPRHRRD